MTPMLSYWCWWLHLGGIAGGLPIAAHTHHHLRAGDHPQPGSKVIKGDSRTSLHPSHEGIICPLSSYSYRRTCRYNLHDLVLPPVKWPHRPPHVHWSTPALEVRVIGSWPKVYQSIVPELYLVSSGLTLGIPLSELPVLATQHLHSNNAELLEGFILDPFAKIKRTKGKGNHLKTLGLFISFNKHKTIAVTGPLIPSRPGVGWCWCKTPSRCLSAAAAAATGTSSWAATSAQRPPALWRSKHRGHRWTNRWTTEEMRQELATFGLFADLSLSLLGFACEDPEARLQKLHNMLNANIWCADLNRVTKLETLHKKVQYTVKMMWLKCRTRWVECQLSLKQSHMGGTNRTEMMNLHDLSPFPPCS